MSENIMFCYHKDSSFDVSTGSQDQLESEYLEYYSHFDAQDTPFIKEIIIEHEDFFIYDITTEKENLCTFRIYIAKTHSNRECFIGLLKENNSINILLFKTKNELVKFQKTELSIIPDNELILRSENEHIKIIEKEGKYTLCTGQRYELLCYNPDYLKCEDSEKYEKFTFEDEDSRDTIFINKNI